MQITKVLVRLFKAKKHNNHMMLRMIEAVIKLIDKQGRGCFIKDYGTTYFNPESGTRDSIAILTSIPNKYLLKNYGLISEEYQKSIVTHLANKYMIDRSIDSEKVRFINFLQKLQDAHDEAFDPYVKIFTDEFRMAYFTSKCELMKEQLK